MTLTLRHCQGDIVCKGHCWCTYHDIVFKVAVRLMLFVIDTVGVSTVNSFLVDTVRVRSSVRDTIDDFFFRGHCQ